MSNDLEAPAKEIAFLVLRAAQTCQNAITQRQKFARLAGLNLMRKTPIDGLIQPEIPPPIDPRQIAMEFAKCCTGQQRV